MAGTLLQSNNYPFLKTPHNGSHCVFYGFCCWDKRHNQKQIGEERVYFILRFVSIFQRSQSRNLEARADAEAME